MTVYVSIHISDCIGVYLYTHVCTHSVHVCTHSAHVCTHCVHVCIHISDCKCVYTYQCI